MEKLTRLRRAAVAKLKALYRLALTLEPARLRAAWVGLVGVTASLGLTVSPVLDKQVGIVLTVLGVVLPLVQGELTRRSVYAPATYDAATRQAGEA